MDPTQPNPPKTDKSRPNPTHGRLCATPPTGMWLNHVYCFFGAVRHILRTERFLERFSWALRCGTQPAAVTPAGRRRASTGASRPSTSPTPARRSPARCASARPPPTAITSSSPRSLPPSAGDRLRRHVTSGRRRGRNLRCACTRCATCDARSPPRYRTASAESATPDPITSFNPSRVSEP